MIAAQDQALNMQYCHRNIKKQPVVSKCWMCCKSEECIKHIIPRSTTLVPSEYTNRHNKLAGCRLLTSTTNIPNRVINVNSIAMMLDIPVIAHYTILANQSNLALHDKKEKICLLIV
jgi:hypothetical protein